MKTCRTCKVTKGIEQFGKHSRNKDGLQTQCKSCKQEYDNNYNSSDDRRIYIKEKTDEYSKRNTKFVFDYLSNHPCVDCGESDVVVLEFDHVTGTKSFTIGNEKRNKSIETIKKEIEKCVVRCANCHRRRTAKQFNWYGLLV